jgi:hypothetical protein
MSAGTGITNILKTSLLETWPKAHEAVTRGIRVNRIGFQNLAAAHPDMANGGLDGLRDDALTPKFALGKKAREGPDIFFSLA